MTLLTALDYVVWAGRCRQNFPTVGPLQTADVGACFMGGANDDPPRLLIVWPPVFGVWQVS
jgi:hypothetical protein